MLSFLLHRIQLLDMMHITCGCYVDLSKEVWNEVFNVVVSCCYRILNNQEEFVSWMCAGSQTLLFRYLVITLGGTTAATFASTQEESKKSCKQFWLNIYLAHNGTVFLLLLHFHL